MNITYINHSGFFIETESCYMMFDYFNGKIPEMGDKPLYVFSSHGHQDHFNREIFHIISKENVKYILSGDIKKRVRTIDNVSIMFTYPKKEYDLDMLHIITLKSTDAGVAYIVEVDGLRIYHGGDLNCWMWHEENKQRNNNMRVNFEREINTIKDMEFDVAFIPLDPRQESYYDMGIKYFLKQCRVKHIFPMHMWEEYSIQDKFLMQGEINSDETIFHKINDKNESWRI